jgi:hypothetical protein
MLSCSSDEYETKVLLTRLATLTASLVFNPIGPPLPQSHFVIQGVIVVYPQHSGKIIPSP